MEINKYETGSNTSCSYKRKLEIIYLICFLTQKMRRKDSKKYPDCITVLGAIFNIDLNNEEDIKSRCDNSGNYIKAYGLICDELLWGTNDELEKPEGITNANEIKDIIIKYFADEWTPF